MAYRNGVYVAFNGCGTVIPTDSDIKYFNILKAWNKHRDDFNFNDSHQKTAQVRDTSKVSTLIDRLNKRLSNSKVLLLIVTDNTKYASSILEHEIIKSVDYYNIPIIATFTGYEAIKETNYNLISKLPTVLKDRVNNHKCKILFIPFKKNAINHAINQFGVNDVIDYNNNIYVYNDISNWD